MSQEFRKRLASGEINPEKLAKMTSQKRREYFSSFLGEENAKNVNTLFERKLLGKRRWDAMLKWAKEVSGVKEPVRRDLISRIEKMRTEKNGDMLSPKEENAFLQDLASSKIGVDVTLDEAKEISKLSRNIEEAKSKDLTKEENRIEYGNRILEMYDYLEEIKPGRTPLEHAINIANVPRALMATFDLSAPLRQGFGMIGRKEFYKSLAPMFKMAFSEKAFRNLQADIVTRETYDNMKKSGLRLTGLGDKLTEREEAFMTTLLDKVPGIRASERGYTGFLTKLRADAFDNLIRKAEFAGEDVRPGSRASKEIASFINDFTGAGRVLNRMTDNSKTVPILNATFFSPRLIASRVQMLNPAMYVNPKMSPTARRERWKGLIAMLGASSTALYLAKLNGANVETDPRSSDFGKFKIGDTRFDTTAGIGAYMTLLARIYSGQTKSTTTEIVNDLSPDAIQGSRYDAFLKFFRNKLSPTASFVADAMAGENAIGEPFTVQKGLVDRAYPLIIQEVIDTYQENPSLATPVFLASLFGISASTYNLDKNWQNNPGKELTQLREKIGEDEFMKANQEYNENVSRKVERILDDQRYKDLDEEGKARVMRKVKEQEKQKIFKKYKFKYKKEPVKKEVSKVEEALVK